MAFKSIDRDGSNLIDARDLAIAFSTIQEKFQGKNIDSKIALRIIHLIENNYEED